MVKFKQIDTENILQIEFHNYYIIQEVVEGREDLKHVTYPKSAVARPGTTDECTRTTRTDVHCTTTLFIDQRQTNKETKRLYTVYTMNVKLYSVALYIHSNHYFSIHLGFHF